MTNHEKAELLESLMPMVRRTAASVARRSGQSADDLAQEAAIVLWRYLDRYDPAKGSSLSTWATNKARWAMADYLRNKGYFLHGGTRIKRQESVDSLQRLRTIWKNDMDMACGFEPISPVDPEPKQIDDRSTIEKLMRACNQFERNILTLYYLEGLPMRIVAQRTGVGESRISQVHKELVARLRRDFARMAA